MNLTASQARTLNLMAEGVYLNQAQLKTSRQALRELKSLKLIKSRMVEGQRDPTRAMQFALTKKGAEIKLKTA